MLHDHKSKTTKSSASITSIDKNNLAEQHNNLSEMSANEVNKSERRLSRTSSLECTGDYARARTYFFDVISPHNLEYTHVFGERSLE